MTRRRALAVTVTAALLLAAVILPACTSTGPEPGSGERQVMEIRSDPSLDTKIDELRAAGRSAPLRELTDFSWDTVYCYYEGVAADKVNAAVGATVLKPGSYLQVSGALAVFIADGVLVKPLVIRELIFDGSAFSANAVVERGVRLTDPASTSASTPPGR